MLAGKDLKRATKLSMVFIIVATIFLIIGIKKALIDRFLIFSFGVALVCIYWALFSCISKPVEKFKIT